MIALHSAGADIIIVNGDVWTLDDASTRAEALAIADGLIMAVGTTDDCRALAHPGTEILDARGSSVVPGLVDGHAHMDREGLKQALPSLAGCKSIPDIKARIRDLVADARPGEWIATMPLGDPPDFRGVPDLLAEGRWPTRHDLDEVAPENPVYIRAIWGYWRHTLPLVSIANSRALEQAGIDRHTVSPASSVLIEKDRSGEPTGVFVETTYMPLVEFTLMACAPRFGHGQRLDALKRSMEIYNGYGTTSVYEGHGVADEVLAAYQALRELGPLPVRSHLVLSPRWRGASAEDVRLCVRDWLGWLRRKGLGDEYLRVQGIFTEPGVNDENRLRAEAGDGYTGWAGFHYDAGLPSAALDVLLNEAAAADIRVSGIGADMLHAFSRAAERASIASARWVVEHISWLSPDEIALARDLGVVMTTHTNRYIWKEGSRLLAEAPKRDPNELVPLRRLLDAGVPVCLATDNVPPTLFHPICHAVTRTGRDGSHVSPDQAVSLEEALRCSSRSGAYLCFSENRRGKLQPGYDADVVVLDRRLDGGDGSAISGTSAAATIIAGTVVHRK